MGRRGPKGRNVSNEQVVHAVASCKSIAEVLRMLDLRVGGGNYLRIKWLVGTLRLDISHWKGSGHRKGTKNPITAPRRLCKVLVFGSYYSTRELKRRLLQYALLPPKCAYVGSINGSGAQFRSRWITSTAIASTTCSAISVSSAQIATP